MPLFCEHRLADEIICVCFCSEDNYTLDVDKMQAFFILPAGFVVYFPNQDSVNLSVDKYVWLPDIRTAAEACMDETRLQMIAGNGRVYLHFSPPYAIVLAVPRSQNPLILQHFPGSLHEMAGQFETFLTLKKTKGANNI